jgi:hypothetical protein
LSISSAGGREETPADEARIAPNSGDIQWLPGQGFEVSFTVTVTGQYATSISLGDSEATHSHSIVLPATLDDGSLDVVPAPCCWHVDAQRCSMGIKRTNLQTLGQQVAAGGSEPGVVYAGMSPINVLSFRVVDVFGNVRLNSDTVDIGVATNAAVVATSSPAQGGVPATGLS